MVEAVIGTLGAGLMAVFRWAMTLNSRLSVQERAQEDFMRYLDTKLDAVKMLNQAISDKMDIKFGATEQRLDRIERSMNGHLIRDSQDGYPHHH